MSKTELFEWREQVARDERQANVEKTTRWTDGWSIICSARFPNGLCPECQFGDCNIMKARLGNGHYSFDFGTSENMQIPSFPSSSVGTSGGRYIIWLS